MKRTLLIGSAMLSGFFAMFYIGYTIFLLVSEYTEATPWAFIALAMMFPTFILMIAGMVFTILYINKQKDTHLLISAILYTLACVVVYQIFYFSILQALINWYYYIRARNQMSHT